MEMINVKSSNIKAIGYNCNVLRIEFVHGAIYDYLNVDSDIYKKFLKAESAGRFFHKYINKKFEIMRKNNVD